MLGYLVESNIMASIKGKEWSVYLLSFCHPNVLIDYFLAHNCIIEDESFATTHFIIWSILFQEVHLTLKIKEKLLRIPELIEVKYRHLRMRIIWMRKIFYGSERPGFIFLLQSSFHVFPAVSAHFFRKNSSSKFVKAKRW